MKALMICISMLAAAYPQPSDELHRVRSMYDLALTDEEACEKLISYVSSVDEKSDPVIAGYKACGMMLMAKYYLNPVNKLSTFNKGKELLDKCIVAKMESTELRFLRFVFQCETPSFLGYNANLKDDKNFILKNYPDIKDRELKEKIKEYMLQSDYAQSNEVQLAITD